MFGVDWEECDTVATVLGIKLLPNEMLAYLELGELRVKGQLSVSMNEKKTITALDSEAGVALSGKPEHHCVQASKCGSNETCK